ncbi:some similarities with Saccharomyces cerevisiae YBR012C Dubious open reading frame, unlikely to encode a functional protein [Maudiozyma barnettii]|uniref:Some similarities with Saccharomyces cerevisiae YBR012C Dubious open reading frame, unlikely to encode a functional protein n=1 Tax=Maudiozyma barnettii TaxID=61262 RepID=A0A8H2VKY2_9SACH|nr:uncharacterized protein KABA2_14S00154 [Kazachstania barnettii]CAB4257260.1 some similarities with Saccharomyces cerevisiae YBR012C Dubious open reading frame, unlikely to encode a functional protein [Kazachstania barnettii]CAD1784525.1 some similarities with Saccharomyces cerevisiae YBR012C Dubious open reading frame, unlikely to encode a functional protein [Kazachstania barnettii]
MALKGTHIVMKRCFVLVTLLGICFSWQYDDDIMVKINSVNVTKDNQLDREDNMLYLSSATDIPEMLNKTGRQYTSVSTETDINLKLMQFFFNCGELLVSVYNYFKGNEIHADNRKVVRQSSFHQISRNGTEWQYFWSSSSLCEYYNSATLDENAETILNYCINDDRYNITLAMCVIVKLAKNCSFQIRMQRTASKPYENMWNMPCGKYQQHINYVDGLCYHDYEKIRNNDVNFLRNL